MDYRQQLLGWLIPERRRVLSSPLHGSGPLLLLRPAVIVFTSVVFWVLYIQLMLSTAHTLLGLFGIAINNACLVFLRYTEIWLRSELPRKLDESNLLAKLAAGPAELGLIYEFVPAGISTFVLGAPPRKLRDSLRLLAANLDWYLAPPRPLRRPVWLMLPLLAMLLLLVLVLSYTGGYIAALPACIMLTLLAVADTVIVTGRRRYAESVRLLTLYVQRMV